MQFAMNSHSKINVVKILFHNYLVHKINTWMKYVVFTMTERDPYWKGYSGYQLDGTEISDEEVQNPFFHQELYNHWHPL